MTNITDQLIAIGQRIRELHSQGLSFRKVAHRPEYDGVTDTTICRMSKNTAEKIVYEPKDAKIREIFGLTVLGLAPVCPKHGIVHPRKTCPPEDKPKAPRIKHICGNCDSWIPRLDGLGGCSSPKVDQHVRGFMTTSSEYGCRFWKKSLTLPSPRGEGVQEEK